MIRLVTVTGMTALGMLMLAPAAFGQFIGGASGVSAGGFSNFGPQFRGGMSPGIVGGFYRPGSTGSITVLSPGIVYDGQFAGPRLMPMNNWAQPVFGGNAVFFRGPLGTNPPPASSGMATYFGGVPVIQQISPNPIVLAPQFPTFVSGPAFNPFFRGPRGTNPPPASSGMATYFGR